MATDFDALAIRKTLNLAGTGSWRRPRPKGPNGWMFFDDHHRRSVIVTCAPHNDSEWVHASMTGSDDVPPYSELVVLHRAVFRDGWAYLPFAPPAEHVNIHANALHLFGRLDGARALPDFTFGTGSI